MKNKLFLLLLFFVVSIFILNWNVQYRVFKKDVAIEGSFLPKVVIVIGTRPEAVKCSPLISLLKNEFYKKRLNLVVISTGQHRELLSETLNSFNQSVDIDLKLMTQNQDLSHFFEISFKEITDKLREIKNIKLVLVHGDTITALSAALAASFLHLPIGHIEAGLRTYDLETPFPEEENRRIIDSISTLWFAPTLFTKRALQKESVCESWIFVTGNTVIDALNFFLSKKTLIKSANLKEIVLKPSKESKKIVILVTMHRRENFNNVETMCNALKNLGNKYKEDIKIILPVHPNPNFHAKIKKFLGNLSNILLIDPIPYDTFPHILNASDMIISDSGGLQEEATALGKPLLLMRNKSDRPEGVYHNSILIVGTNSSKIELTAEKIINNIKISGFNRLKNDIFGDGKASQRIADVIEKYLYHKLPIQNQTCSSKSRQSLIAKEVYGKLIP